MNRSYTIDTFIFTSTEPKCIGCDTPLTVKLFLLVCIKRFVQDVTIERFLVIFNKQTDWPYILKIAAQA